jgi:hypothetical protein
MTAFDAEPFYHPIVEDKDRIISLALRTYTPDEAEEIFKTLHTTYDEAHAVLPVQYLTESLHVEFEDEGEQRPPVNGFAYASRDSIRILLNYAFDAATVIKGTREVMLHEVAHIAHSRINPTFYAEKMEPIKHQFASAVAEGVAITAGRSLNAFDQWSEAAIGGYSEKERLKLLLETNADRAFKDTKPEIPMYHMSRIGEFVVSRFARQYNLDTHSTMQIPLAEFRDFAQSLT